MEGRALEEAWKRSKHAEGDEVLWFGHLPSEIPMGHPSGLFDEHVEKEHLESTAGRWPLR